MSDRPLRLAYVGCGFVAQNVHIPNFASLPECELYALAEPRRELGEKVQARYGFKKLYRSHEELCADPEIEAVAVSAPFSIQSRVAEDLLSAGKHVFMEKPMAVSVQRAEAMLKAQKAGKSRLMVAYMKRYDAGNLLLKKHFDAWRASGEAGPLKFARNHGYGGNWVYAQDTNIPFEKSPEAPPAAPTDAPAWLPEKFYKPYLGFLQQWTHNLNLLRFLLNDRDGDVKIKAVDLDDDGMSGVVVVAINGTRCVLETGYTKFHGWDEHTQIFFEGGWLRTEAPALLHKQTSATVEIYRAAHGDNPPRKIQEFAPPTWSYKEEAKHFLKCLRTGDPFASSGEDTLHDVRFFEDVYRKFIGK